MRLLLAWTFRCRIGNPSYGLEQVEGNGGSPRSGDYRASSICTAMPQRAKRRGVRSHPSRYLGASLQLQFAEQVVNV
jgi:hypothetical protein